MSEVNLALTAAGQVLKAKIEAGNGDIPLNITRIVTASGTSSDPLNLTDVVDKKQEFSITDRRVTGARTAISAILTNQGNAATGEQPLAMGYPLSQIGFYAIDPDDGEILYRISQFDTPNYVPAAKERGWSYEPTFNFVTGNATEVNITMNPAGMVTNAQLDAVREIAQEALAAAAASGKTGRRVIAVRDRDPAKPTYGIGDGGDTVAVTMEAVPYTGTAEVSVTVDGAEFDVNMSTDSANAPEGTMIIKKL